MPPRWSSSPSNVKTCAELAPHSSSAAAAIVSNTGCTSVGDWLMTRRISLVAVCCSSASVRSRLRASSSVNRRTFSIAIDRLVGEGLEQRDLVSGNSPGSRRYRMIAPRRLRPRSSGTARTRGIRRPWRVLVTSPGTRGVE